MKYAIVILDGAAGEPCAHWDGATTLEEACTPLLDMMARKGRIGMVKNVPDGIEPSSSAACTSIIGYDPANHPIGRAAIEAAAMGIELAPGEIAMRVNTVTVLDDTMKSYAGGHITSEESHALIETLQQELGDDNLRFYPGVGYRHIAVIKGYPGLTHLTYTAPHDITDKPVAGEYPRVAPDEAIAQNAQADSAQADSAAHEAAAYLKTLMEQARPLLAAHPINKARLEAGKMPVTDIWPFWPGTAPESPMPFTKKYGKRAALSSGVDLLFGIARIYGLDELHIEGVTDNADTDYVAQAVESLAAFEDHDVVVIHIEAPDETGHAGDFEAKKEAIENIDRLVLSRLVAYAHATGDLRILALPDHPTPEELKTHTGKPVPFVLWGPGIERDESKAYSERAAEASGVLVDPGYLLMEQLLAE